MVAQECLESAHYAGHSPAPIGADVDGLQELLCCLKSVTPQLETIQSENWPNGAVEDGAGSAGGRMK